MDSEWSDSASGSDASHISATPPRNPSPSPPPPTLLRSLNPRARVKPKPKPKQTAKLKSPINPTKSLPQQSPQSDPLSGTLPFQIRCVSTLQAPAPIETLPAGYFSKSASFSKLRRPDVALNFESPEKGVGPEPPDRLRKKPKVQLPNLVGSAISLPSPPVVKLRKCGGSGGNFVKLNLNGSGKRRFLNRKGKGNSNYSSSGRRYYRRIGRGKRRLNPGSVSEDEAGGDGFVPELKGRNGPRKGDEDLVKKAVLAARDEVSDENLLRLLNVIYGFDSFRDGQLEAIKMVLGGRSTMLVLHTGAGKTLCYQIPALILHGITLVVSPLVALMIDQLKQLPPAIPGGLLCSSQTPHEVAETFRLLQEGRIKVLFVSPERLLNPEFLSVLTASPSISLLVIDEAHCISEWSHNFRPSYMRLKASFLRATLNIGCILAMTATATTTTLNSVMSALEIPSTNLIQNALLRDNLQLSISSSGNRMKDLLLLMKSSPFLELQSIIIYCKFQSETDMISRNLCDKNISAKSYHSAIPPKERSYIQELFCSNKIKVVVATVAFGMGLDKKDVGAVIHYGLPESLEEYVQEIGRAGRDGSLSYCHLVFDDSSYFKLRSLMHSDGIDEYVVNKFLSQVFIDGVSSCGKIYSLIKESASRKFDMKEEVMFTILTQLELGEVNYLRLFPQLNVTCSLNFYKTLPEVLAEKDKMASAILKRSEIKHGLYIFDIPTVANSIGITTTDLLNWLQELKLKGEITYELKDLAYCYSVMEVPQDFCSLSLQLTKWLSEVERCKIEKLDTMYDAALYAVNTCEKVQGCCDAQHTPCMHRKILGYFKEADRSKITNWMSRSSPFLRGDIKVFLQSNSQAKFTPRAIARIMHGIASPAYPSAIWSKTHFWGSYTNVDFQVIMDAAKEELMNFERVNP